MLIVLFSSVRFLFCSLIAADCRAPTTLYGIRCTRAQATAARTSVKVGKWRKGAVAALADPPTILPAAFLVDSGNLENAIFVIRWAILVGQ